MPENINWKKKTILSLIWFFIIYNLINIYNIFLEENSITKKGGKIFKYFSITDIKILQSFQYYHIIMRFIIIEISFPVCKNVRWNVSPIHVSQVSKDSRLQKSA